MSYPEPPHRPPQKMPRSSRYWKRLTRRARRYVELVQRTDQTTESSIWWRLLIQPLTELHNPTPTIPRQLYRIVAYAVMIVIALVALDSAVSLGITARDQIVSEPPARHGSDNPPIMEGTVANPTRPFDLDPSSSKAQRPLHQIYFLPLEHGRKYLWILMPVLLAGEILDLGQIVIRQVLYAIGQIARIFSDDDPDE
ncbi:MAG: hypothetical protein ACQGVK_06430 [Myxococcota bacterium]